MSVTETQAPIKESFAALLDESLGVSSRGLEGTVVKGRVISVENDAALIDVGLKSEGRVPLKEFSAGGADVEINVGDIVEVFLERMEDKNGEAPLSRSPQPFQILKMDRSRGNIVVSRRAVLEESRAEQRSELVASLKEGQILTGVVKNITDYGAFVDLGGVDGLLHVTDIPWRRINHPSEALHIGQSVKV